MPLGPQAGGFLVSLFPCLLVSLSAFVLSLVAYLSATASLSLSYRRSIAPKAVLYLESLYWSWH